MHPLEEGKPAPEYYHKTITRLFKGNRLYGCYALAVTIFTIGIIRDSM
jgi:phosphatidylethanolamine/phosphatidyl-N-methylethanolamine N-methyltransferase